MLKNINRKFSHALLFLIKYMHRNYCFRCKRHSYSACVVALAASIYIYMIMSYSCRKYQMISRNFSRCNERYDHHYTSTFVNSCIKICRKQRRKKYWDRCESYPGRMKRLVLLFITLFSGLSLSRPCKEQENIFDPLRKFENYLELFYTPVFCLV